MNELVKFKIVELPKIYIVGKQLQYSDDALNSGDNRLPAFWNKCCAERIFTPLDRQTNYVFKHSPAGVFLDWDLGDGDFSYIVGLLMKEGAAAPPGYIVRELKQTKAAWCQIKCKALKDTRSVPFESTAKAIRESGYNCSHMKWCIDLYHPLRSAIPDENGHVILDCYIPVE